MNEYCTYSREQETHYYLVIRCLLIEMRTREIFELMDGQGIEVDKVKTDVKGNQPTTSVLSSQMPEQKMHTIRRTMGLEVSIGDHRRKKR